MYSWFFKKPAPPIEDDYFLLETEEETAGYYNEPVVIVEPVIKPIVEPIIKPIIETVITVEEPKEPESIWNTDILLQRTWDRQGMWTDPKYDNLVFTGDYEIVPAPNETMMETAVRMMVQSIVDINRTIESLVL